MYTKYTIDAEESCDHTDKNVNMFTIFSDKIPEQINILQMYLSRE